MKPRRKKAPPEPGPLLWGGDLQNEFFPPERSLLTPAPAPPPPASPPEPSHFNRIQQIHSLTHIADHGNTDMGFMARLLTLCSLPRTNPGNRLQYKRRNGPFKLIMIAGGDNKLPFGNLPRLLLAWICTETVRTRQRDLTLGKSLAAFMRELGIHSDSGGSRGDRTRLRNQIDRLFHCQVELIYEVPGGKRSAASRVADSTDLWWDYRKPDQSTLWESHIRLGEALFNEILTNPIPLDMQILRSMRRSSLGLDLYMWLSYKTYTLYSLSKEAELLSWEQLYRQFGTGPEQAENKYVVRDFRKDVLREIVKLRTAWPALDIAFPKGFLEIRPCPPSVQPRLP